ncbi:MAG: ferredoxin oxidoreductase [Patescibacteria group bacterium]|jgi:2-oxoglutarate ferredoxin oxidoreductase subunit alpha
MKKQVLISGNEAAVLGTIDAGATVMFGYPITPATEILEGYIRKAEENPELKYLQTEDEIAAGFGVLGSVLGGVKSFTASAGPGHVLLQDPIAMAENLRLPFVGIIMQRGGPSTGTVNFSQQEVTLAAFGGNGDGHRIVYSASTVPEMYELTKKSFETAWKYRFPTILLGDGYLGKMKNVVEIDQHSEKAKSSPILEEKAESTNLRNCYSSEESFGAVLDQTHKDWQKSREEIVESESYKVSDAKTLIVAHGLVASAARDAVKIMRKSGARIGLFRPITLNPFDKAKLLIAAKKTEKIIIIESSLNQLSRIVKYEMAGQKAKFIEISKSAQGFTPEEIIDQIRRHNG